MKIGIISDIHGNAFALNEVLCEIKTNNINTLFVLGDLTGYYYNTDKVLKMLKEFKCEIIHGNHEVLLDKVLRNEIDISTVNIKYGKGIEYAIKKCSKEELNFLVNLDSSKSINVDNLKIGLFHGSPNKNDEYIYPNSNKLNELNKDNYDYIFMGHTHRPFFYIDGKCAVVNVGSVGQNRVRGGIASWMILDTEFKTLQPMATPYNIEELINEIDVDDIAYLKSILIR